MKRIIIAAVCLITAALLAITFWGGSAEQEEEVRTYSSNHVVVDVATGTNGFYALMAKKATVKIDENDELLSVYAEDTYLLAYKVSDFWKGGVYLYSGEEMQSIIDALKAIAGDNKDLWLIIEQLEYGGPLEGAST